MSDQTEYIPSTFLCLQHSLFRIHNLEISRHLDILISSIKQPLEYIPSCLIAGAANSPDPLYIYIYIYIYIYQLVLQFMEAYLKNSSKHCTS